MWSLRRFRDAVGNSENWANINSYQWPNNRKLITGNYLLRDYSGSPPWILRSKKPQAKPTRIRVKDKIAPLKSMLSALIFVSPCAIAKTSIIWLRLTVAFACFGVRQSRRALNQDFFNFSFQSGWQRQFSWEKSLTKDGYCLQRFRLNRFCPDARSRICKLPVTYLPEFHRTRHGSMEPNLFLLTLLIFSYFELFCPIDILPPTESGDSYQPLGYRWGSWCAWRTAAFSRSGNLSSIFDRIRSSGEIDRSIA